MMRGLLLTGALMLALACAPSGPRWVKPGASPADLDRATDDCMSKATIAGDYGNPEDRARIERDMENCMTSRGWRRPPKQ